MDYNILNHYENTRDSLNNTDKLYIVVVEYLLYLFDHSTRLYFLFTQLQ